MSIGNYAENKMITDLLITPGCFVALHTADPGETGTGELSGGSYVRKAAGLAAPVNGVSTNAADILYTGMPASTITHLGLWDAATAGNFLWGGVAGAPKTYAAGDECKVTAGTLSVTLD